MFYPPDDVMKDFRFFQPVSLGGSKEILLHEVPIVLGTLTLQSGRPGDRQWLTAAIGWQGKEAGIGAGRTDVIFSLHRDSPHAPAAYEVRVSTDPTFARAEMTAMSYVDPDVFEPTVTYYLIGTAPLPGSLATVTGPLTFTGLVLAKKEQKG